MRIWARPLALLALILLGPLFLFATPLSWLAMNWAMLLLLEAWLFLMAAVIGALVGTERSVLTLLDGHLRRWVAWFAPDPEPLWLHWARHAHHPQMAHRYLDRAARLGGAEALFQEGLVFLEGGFGMGGESTAVERFRKAAALGHAEAAFRLAEALRTGSSAIGRNPVEAETWYRRAAAKGFGPAAAWLAQAYLHGDGVGLDADQASHWAALAEQLRPYPPLSHNLLRHDAAPVDPLVAFTRDCLTALELGVAHLVSHRAGRWVLVVAAVLFAVLGIGIVGVFFWTGSSGLFHLPLLMLAPPVLMLAWQAWELRRDMPRRGRDPWRKAAEQGDPEACYRMGLLHRAGSPHLPKDDLGAVLWFRKAARGRPPRSHDRAGRGLSGRTRRAARSPGSGPLGGSGASRINFLSRRSDDMSGGEHVSCGIGSGAAARFGGVQGRPSAH
jgi:hypothetical protein